MRKATTRIGKNDCQENRKFKFQIERCDCLPSDEVRAVQSFSIRLFQADYRWIHTNYGPTAPSIPTPGALGGRANLSAAELSTGIVAHIGHIIPPPPVTYACSVSPTTVYPGDPITVTGTAANLNPKKPATYTWSADGGVISGTSSTATIDTKTAAVGASGAAGAAGAGMGATGVAAGGTMVAGMALPLAIRLLERDGKQMGGIGLLYGFNTAGAIAGTLLTAWLLVPYAGSERTLYAGALLSKEPAVMFPLVVGAHAIVFSEKAWKEKLVRAAHVGCNAAVEIKRLALEHPEHHGVPLVERHQALIRNPRE